MYSHEITATSVRVAAMNFLAIREHSSKELYTKLAKKFDQIDWILAAIETLKQEGFQSDERFAEAYARMRLRQGKGPLVIRLELKERGISDDLIHEYLTGITDWNESALKAYQKKFRGIPIPDLKEKSKRTRFLTTRGFSAANIQYVFKQSLLENDEK